MPSPGSVIVGSIGCRNRGCRGVEPLLAIRVAFASRLLGDQRGADRLVLQTIGLDILQPLHLGGRRVFQRRQVGALLLGLVLLVGELLALVGEVGVEGVEPVEVVGRRVVDHLEEGVDLDLVLG